MSTPTFPPPPIELQILGNGPDALPAPPQSSPSPQTSTSPNERRPNSLKGDRHRSKEPPQNSKYNSGLGSGSGSGSGSTRATTPSPIPLSSPGSEIRAQRDSKPRPPLMDPRFTNLENGIIPAPAPEPANTKPNPNMNMNVNPNAAAQHAPPLKRDLAIEQTGTVIEMLDRPYLTPDDDAVPMRPHEGGWGRDEGRDGRHHHKKHEDQLDSLHLPLGYRVPPRYGDPAAARRSSSSSSDTMHSTSSSGCHGQSSCVLWCAICTTLCMMPCGVIALAFAVMARVYKVDKRRRMKYQWRCRSFCCSLLALVTLALLIAGVVAFLWKAGPELSAGLRIAKKHPLSLQKVEKLLDTVKNSKIKEQLGSLANDLKEVMAEEH